MVCFYCKHGSGIDPWLGTVDDPDSIEDGASRPVYYVLAVDNGKLFCHFFWIFIL